MMVKYGNRVLQTTTTVGTGTYTLGGAPTGWNSFLSAGGITSGDRVGYTVVDSLDQPTQWEVVEGVITAGSSVTLTRAAVLSSSNGGGAVNWGAETKYVYSTIPAQRAMAKDENGGVPFDVGSAVAPSAYFGPWSGSGFFSPGADAVAVANAGVESWRLSATGNMYVGTAGTAQIPGERIAVRGFVTVGDTTHTGLIGPTGAGTIVVGAYSGTTVELRSANVPQVMVLPKASANRAITFIGGSSSDGTCATIGTNSGDLGVQANLRPVVDNAYSLGASDARLSAIWSANGTIQTSHGPDKADREPIDGARAARFLALLQPITFRWREGGVQIDVVPDEPEIVERQKMRRVQREVERVAVENGRAIVRVEFEEVDEPMFLEYPMFTEAGQAIRGADGSQITYRVPVMETVEIPRSRLVLTPRAGRRRHAGWVAQDVVAAALEAGIATRDGDAVTAPGFWVLEEDGRQALRPDQLLPYFAAAVQHLFRDLDARVEAIERSKSNAPD
ncbi:hypothetical protein [Roseomonas genomospecies 6]|uniref:Peptidase S74 domain-containing protein n=1 Tax=Roseomonas genomospecies 6 TaxID=214106 RepID=A0A9W7NMS0_9PROT|nr:hypothetical protein [Roseomonas genomospecies 6]KAA0683338.1 hypothetical protein DS843_02785 [Roseomonas genomospecies 6]